MLKAEQNYEPLGILYKKEPNELFRNQIIKLYTAMHICKGKHSQ